MQRRRCTIRRKLSIGKQTSIYGSQSVPLTESEVCAGRGRTFVVVELYLFLAILRDISPQPALTLLD